MKTAVLIPSYRPDGKLIDLICGLVDAGLTDIIIVNDGSGEGYGPIFAQAEKLGCHILHHAVNLGKGRALKDGMNYFLVNFPQYSGVVTADADGQHLPSDIREIAMALDANPHIMFLGSRDFSDPTVPKRSRFGNKLTRTLMSYFIGIKLLDTQTGLRAIPASFIKYLIPLKGERYDYEMSMLYEAKKQGVEMIEIPISTVYIEDNASSHFNPIVDGVKIYATMAKFIVSSVLSAIVDIAMFALLSKAIFSGLADANLAIALSTAVARVISSSVNFLTNKNLVFHSKSGAKKGAAARYFTLALIQVSLSYLFVWLAYDKLRIDEVLAKIIVDSVLFVLSFKIQQKWVFGNKTEEKEIVSW